MHNVCPGARLFRQPKPEFFTCPSCGAEVEIWTDELKATCPNCKKTVYRDQNLSCVEWCEFGEECIGENLYKTYITNRNSTIKKKLLAELETHCGKDKVVIDSVKKILDYAEQLLVKEDGDWHITIPAVILYVISQKNGNVDNISNKIKYINSDCSPVVKKILLKLGMKLKDIKEICEIIAHYQNKSREIIRSNNYKIFNDANLLESLKYKVKTVGKNKLQELIDKLFITNSGKMKAIDIYLKNLH